MSESNLLMMLMMATIERHREVSTHRNIEWQLKTLINMEEEEEENDDVISIVSNE